MPEAIEAAPKKKSKLKWIILIVILLLILGGGGAGAWFFFLKDKWHAKDDPTAAPTQTAQAAKSGGKPGSAPAAGIVALPPFTVNLSDPLGRRFIKLGISVEIKNPAVAAELQQQEARVRDAVIMLLSSKTYADISPMEGRLILKNEITDRLNQIVGASKISQVFITEMVIQ